MVSNEIEANVAANKVMIYSKSYCPFCVQAKDLLTQKGVEFKSIELDQVGGADNVQNAIQAKWGQRTVPAIWVNGEFIGGCSELKAANANGSLDAKLSA